MPHIEGHEDGGRQIAADARDEVDERHPLPANVVLEVAHEHHLEEDCDGEMEDTAKYK